MSPLRKNYKYVFIKPAHLKYFSVCEGLGFRKASGELSARIHLPKNQSKKVLKKLADAGIFKIKRRRLFLTKKARKLLEVLE
jgi:transcription initiation factor IIE alpha subunit